VTFLHIKVENEQRFKVDAIIRSAVPVSR